MTNPGIIKKITRYAGLNETESRFFFEAFAQKLFEELKPGDSVRIDKIGYFYLKNISTVENEKEIKGLVFSETKEVTKNSPIFFSPSKSGTFYPDDFSFSVSLKKMEIPLGDELDRTLFIPPSGSEMLSFIDAKVENLLNESEVIKTSIKGEEKYIIHPIIPAIQVIEKLDNVSEFQASLEEEIDPEKFQKIDSLYPDFLKDDQMEKEEPDFIEEPEISSEPYETEDKDIRYKRVESLIKPEIKPEEKKPLEEEESKKEETSNLVINTPEVREETKEEKIELEKIKKPEQIELKERRARKKIYVPLILFVIVLAGAVLYYLMVYRTTGTAVKQISAKVPVSNPVVIQRDNDIPVNDADESETNKDITFDPISSAVYSTEKKDEQLTEAEIPTVPKGTYKEYEDYIFSDGKTFFIQVSSWKSLNRAEEHASELKSKGFDTSIERVISSNGNVYYRVKLGNFNSLEEAKSFLQKQ